MASRYCPHAPFGISAEQLLGVGKLRPSPPTEQAVDREVSLDVVDEEQISVLARKPDLLHDRGGHLLSAALDDARRQISATVDTQVKKTFPTERICNYQGSFAHLQCKQPCCDEFFDASSYVERMLTGMAGFEVRSEDVPRCPHCGWQLVPWVHDDTFLQGAAWRESLGRYERFVRERGNGCVLLLELGVDEITPGIITLPFWSMTAKLPDAHLLSVNISSGSAPLQLGSKAGAIQADLDPLLSAARACGE